ncbi:UDP-Glycosyltransferase [Physocladia obscura]|uniref:UDP-Glycosyltransferase n=1 Tax=Physocladia obscura TaxID=109957 RepID=A0AAD5X5P8_9FUNG|nr:UDP-Glycosyltransferase [Physocladia obscura]
MSTPLGAILHEAFGTRVVAMPMFPGIFEETVEFPPMADIPDLGQVLNKMLYWFAITLMWFVFKPTLDKCRALASLPPVTWRGIKYSMKQKNMPIHHTWSTVLHPKPADWDPETTIGGYMFYDKPSNALLPDLEEFLNAGSPPVYVGFGSMPVHMSSKFVPLIKQLLEFLPKDMRVIVYAGGMSNLTTDSSSRAGLKNELLSLDTTKSGRIHVVYSVPQHLLFPRCSVIVHHGGSGTTGEACRSGVPSMACPLVGDQYFWAKRIAAIGCGPAIGVAFRKMTGKYLAGKILEALEPKHVEVAKLVGEKIRAETGTDNAVDFIMKHLFEERQEKNEYILINSYPDVSELTKSTSDLKLIFGSRLIKRTFGKKG